VPKPGANQIEVKVINAWVNRLIEDQQPGATEYTYADVKPYEAKSPLPPSGLIGPSRTGEGQRKRPEDVLMTRTRRGIRMKSELSYEQDRCLPQCCGAEMGYWLPKRRSQCR
jgi:hypothetical protein